MNNLSNKTPANKPPRASGFTLIELIIVIAVLGVLATVVTLRFTGVQASARDAKRQSEVRQYQTSLEVYANRTGTYPNTTATADSLCGTLGLTGCPDDPVTTQHYEYSGNGADYVLWATLERKDTSGNTEYFVLCSNGKVGKIISEPSNSNCPLP